MLSWPICEQTSAGSKGTGGGQHVCHPSLTLSLSGIVDIACGGATTGPSHAHTHAGTHTHTNTHLALNLQQLISVSDKVEQRVHSALHNKSISGVIEFHQSPLFSRPPRGVSLSALRRPLPRDSTTVIIQLPSFLPS